MNNKIVYTPYKSTPDKLLVAEQFCCFLYNEDHLKHGKIDKETMRSIFMHYKQYNKSSQNMNFFNLIMAMMECQLLQRNKTDKSVLHFKEQSLRQIVFGIKENLPTQSHTKMKIKNNINSRNNFSPKTTRYVSQRFALRTKHQEQNYVSENRCDLCDVQLKDKIVYNTHLNDVVHNLRKTYRTNRKELLSENKDIIIEVEKGHGNEQEDIVTRINTSKISITIQNISKNAYIIDNLYLLYKKIKEITVQYNLPIILKPKTTRAIQIQLSFTSGGSYILPIIFAVNNKTNKTSVNILKDLVIRVQSEIVDDLKPISPYKRGGRPIVLVEELPIINGERPESIPKELIYVYSLKQFKIPHEVGNILNAGFKVHPGMTNAEHDVLKDVKTLLAVPDRNNAFTERNYGDLLELLLYIEEHQMQKNIHDYDCTDQILNVIKGKPNLLSLSVPGLAENRPSLIRGDSVLVTVPGDKVRYEGIVHFIRDTDVWLGFHKSFTKKIHSDLLRYNVSFTFNRFPLRAEHQAVELMKQHLLEDHFFPVAACKNNKLITTQFNWFNVNILNNKEQQQAVRHIVSCTSYPAPYLLFGPPGTGKTMTLVETILQLWKTKPNCRILVAAPSNSAANEITSRLIKFITSKTELFRMMSASQSYEIISDDLKPFCNFRDGMNYFPSIETIMTYRVVVVTLVTAARLYNGCIPFKHFQYVFVDESGHSTESEILIAIAGIISSTKDIKNIAGQIVLCGDPKQLGPIVHSDLAKQYGYGTSMLERLMNTCDMYKKDPKTEKYNPNYLTKLLKNFRSHSAILNLPDRMFYDNELVPSAGSMSNIAVNWKCLPNFKFPLIFHSVLGMDEREESSPSYFNCQEIDVVIDYLNSLIGTHLNGMEINQTHIGIVSPYRKQVCKLSIACKKKGWTDILIGSVEQFQGQERLIIIISTVRSRQEFVNHDYKFHLGFLKNPKRFNVAITRAKALVIVVGNPLILQCDPHWGEFITYCRANDATCGTEWTYHEQYAKLENIALDLSQLELHDAEPSDFTRCVM